MNVDNQLPKFVSVSDLQRDYASLLKTLHQTNKPLLVLKKNNLEAVILPPNVYQSLIEKARQCEEEEALAAIKTYRREKTGKKLKKIKSVSELFE